VTTGRPLSRLAWIAWTAVGVVSLLLLATPSVTLPAADLGIRRFLTPDVRPGTRLSQTFTMTTSGLSAVEFSAAPAGERVAGRLRLTLVDVTRDPNANAVLRSAEVAAVDLVRAPRYRFEFVPVADSKQRLYRLDVASADTQPASGVALRATKGERYPAGSLFVNGIWRWADLAFKADAPAPSIGRMVVDWRPADRWRRTVAIAGLLAGWLALGAVFQALSAAWCAVPDLVATPGTAADRS
jgi:hypothetical protein